MKSFNVVHRGEGHWDIYVNSKRTFTIRGCSGAVSVDNQISGHRLLVKTVNAGMSFICDQLMFERTENEGA